MTLPEPFRPCVVIPCLDGEGSVGAVVRGVREVLDAVIVVDDGSTDATLAEASAAGAEVITHPDNRGKGVALMTGLDAAARRGYTHMVSLDADGQHHPEDLPTLLEAARSQLDALVIGARDFDVENVPGASRFGRNFSNFWVRLETGRTLADTQSGFRVYPVEHVMRLPLRPSRFEWEVEVIVRAAWAGLPVLEVPIGVTYAPPGERISHYRGVADSTRISLMHCRLVARWLLIPLRRPSRLIPR